MRQTALIFPLLLALVGCSYGGPYGTQPGRYGLRPHQENQAEIDAERAKANPVPPSAQSAADVAKEVPDDGKFQTYVTWMAPFGDYVTSEVWASWHNNKPPINKVVWDEALKNHLAVRADEEHADDDMYGHQPPAACSAIEPQFTEKLKSCIAWVPKFKAAHDGTEPTKADWGKVEDDQQYAAIALAAKLIRQSRAICSKSVQQPDGSVMTVTYQCTQQP